MINKIGLLILTMFGIGRIGSAPGTVASFVTCLIYIPLIISIRDIKWALSPSLLPIIFFILILLYSISSIDKLSNHFKEKDPKEIVIDEFLGQSVPLLAIYYATFGGVWNWNRDNWGMVFFLIFLCFVVFRFFDIIKPFPINLIDKKMKNGIGIVLDDIVAGFYTTIVVLYFLPIFIKEIMRVF